MSVTKTIKVSRPMTAEIRITLTSDGELCVNDEVIAFINSNGELELDYVDGDSPLQTEVHDGSRFVKVVR